MKKDNIEALKSSALTGVAFALCLGGITYVTGSPHFKCLGALGLVSGFCLGVLTTWYPEE